MRNLDNTLPIGKMGFWYQYMPPNEVIFNAAKKYTDRMMDLIRDKVIANTKISDEAFEEIKHYLQKHITGLVTDLIAKDFPDFVLNERKKSVKKIKTSTTKNAQLQKAPAPPSLQLMDKLNGKLIYHIENVLMIPFFLIALSSRNQQKAISIATKEIRELIEEVNRLMHYKEIFEAPRTPREEFVRDILIAIDKLKKMPGKLTRIKISKEFTPKRTTFYGKLEKHRLEINKNFEVIDKKTNKPFEFS